MRHGRLNLLALDAPLRIDVWSDIVCPFCWIGKRHLEEALRRSGIEAEVFYHAYELNPRAGPTRPLSEYLRERFGAGAGQMQGHVTRMGEAAGLAFRWEDALYANTFDAHRLVLFAQAQGLGSAMVERLMLAHFQEGRDLADSATLLELASEVGLRGDKVDAFLLGDELADEARRDEAQAQAMGVRGVPFFVLDGRFGLSGAQPPEVFERAFAQAAATRGAPSP